jgi:hypothetical protein
MADPSGARRARFLDWMQSHGLTAPQVAKASGVPVSTLYSFIGSRRARAQGATPAPPKTASLTGANEARIAEAFGASVEQVFGGRAAPAIPVQGHVGARADVFPLDPGAALYEILPPPGLDPDESYVAFEIEGFSMPPAEPGWVVVFKAREYRPEDLVNSACMVDLVDGRRLFKRLRRGRTPGRFDLESWDGSPPIEDVEVLTALPFVALTPGRMGR